MRRWIPCELDHITFSLAIYEMCCNGGFPDDGFLTERTMKVASPSAGQVAAADYLF